MGSMFRSDLFALVALGLTVAACSRAPEPLPTTRYELDGQILAVNTDAREITVKHGDIVGLMPAMTMTFPVAAESDLLDRNPGDMIRATLEVTGGQGRLANVVKTGSAPLPANTNEVALAAGLLEEGDAVPDAALIDQTDRRRSLSEWTGTPMLVGFVYTTCPFPNFCPLIDRNFAALQRAIAADSRLAGRVRLLSISIDPTHDTPAVLAAHATKLEADPAVWTFLTGDPATVDRVAGRYGVGITRPEAPGDISHNLRTTLVGRDGHVRKIYSGNEWTTDEVLDDLRAAVSAR
jgi:protein SCO1/2